MKKLVLSYLLVGLTSSNLFSLGYKERNGDFKIPAAAIHFTENKGQVHDQNYNSRPDVLFGGTDGNLVFHLKESGISYQLNRVDTWASVSDEIGVKIDSKIADQITIYRLDVNWLNANTKPVIQKGVALPGYENYYSENCPNGITNVKSYEEITYQNIYKGVDLRWYQKDGHLKYDYTVAAGIGYKQIQLEYRGAEKLSINYKGELLIKTPLGEITEHAPVVIQKGKTLKSKWKLKNNIASFEIEELDPSQSYIIDPEIRAWGTYYGGASTDNGYYCSTDPAGYIYLAGSTASGSGSEIATSGSYQATYGGVTDAFLSKFDSLGVRQWATYYGGSGNDFGYACATDAIGNVYLTGQTNTSTTGVISTAGSHQVTYGGADDAFLVKFNSLGLRQWGTYYGGTGNDYGYHCTADATGTVCIAGAAQSTTTFSIATSGSHQPSNAGGAGIDAFVAKFNSSGVRQWGTYYGGTNLDYGHSCNIDIFGNVFLAGYTNSGTGTVIATTGSHQSTFGGGGSNNDAFLVKFNSAGVRQWGTYYGGTGIDYGYSCCSDLSGNIYLAGYCPNTSGTIIATAGSHQPTYGGSTNDAFLAKFDPSGTRLWATFYGGGGTDRASHCITDTANNVYLAGSSAFSTGTTIATPGTHQPSSAGNYDAYVVKFNMSGVRQWGTYYGGGVADEGRAVAIVPSGSVYLAGYTASGGGTSIATAASHQPIYGGATDAFLTKFIECTLLPTPGIISGPTTICSGSSTTYSIASVPGALSYTWILPSGWTGTSTTTSISTVSSSTSGNISVTANNACAPSLPSTLSVTVSTTPASPGTISGADTVCPGSNHVYSITAIASATSYTWTLPSGWTGTSSTNSISATASSSGGTISVTADNSCGSSTPQTLIVITNAAAPATPGTISGSSIICSGSNNSYSIVAVPGATSYTWTLPGGWSGTSSTNSISTTASTLSGNISVTAENACGISPAQSLAINVNTNPAIPGTISGATTVCSGSSNTYSIAPIAGATSFTWTLPFAWSGTSSTDSISTTASTSGGNITVTANNSCGSSLPQSIVVNVNTSPTAAYTQSPSTVCVNTTSVALGTASPAGGTFSGTAVTGGTFDPSSAGTGTFNITYTYTDANGCSDTALSNILVDPCTEISALGLNEIHISPNPTKGTLYLNGLETHSQIEVWNVLGSLVISSNESNNKMELDLSSLENGVYFIKIKTENYTSTKRIIKN